MKIVVNKTSRPLRLPLPKGKTLFLGPLKSGQIAPKAEAHPPLKAMVEAGQIEIQDAEKTGPTGHSSGAAPQASTSSRGGRGVAKTTKGDRGA